jgi:phage-related minor tail protein
MAKVKLDLESNAQPVIDDWNRLNKTGEELNQTTKEFGDTSSKSFKEASDGAAKLGKSVTETTKDQQKGVKSLDDMKRALNELSTARDKSTDTTKIKQFNQQIEKGEAEIRKLTNTGKQGFDEMGNAIEDTGSKFGGILDIAGGFGLAFGIDALIGGLINVGTAVVETVGQFRTLRGEVQTLTGATGQNLDNIVTQATAIAETFDTEVNEVIKAANVLSQEFGLTQEEALAKVASAATGVAGDTEELIEQTKEYATQIRAAGGDADTLFNIINKSAVGGVFSDKGVDVVKEFGLRIREQTTGTKDALEAAFGPEFTDGILKGVADGSITSIDALEQISEKMNDTTIPANELQTVIADVFGGAGEDAGLAYLQSLTDISGSVEGLIDNTNVLTREQQASLKANEDLAKAQNELSKLFDDQAGNTFFTQLQTVGFELLVGVIEPILDLFSTLREAFSPLIDAVSELGTTIFGAGESFSFLDVVLAPLKISFEVIGFVLGLVAQALTFVVQEINEFVKSSPILTAAFETIGRVIDQVKEQFNDFKDLLSSGFDAVGAAGKKAARTIDENYTQPYLKQIAEASKAEREALKEKIKGDQIRLLSALKVLKANGELNTIQGQQLLERAKAGDLLLKEINSQEKAEVEAVKAGEEEKAAVRDAANKEQAAANKKAADDRKKALEKAQADFDKTLGDLAKQSAKVELDALSGEERTAALREIREAEIQVLEDALIEQGQILATARGEEFELTKGQLEQLEILRQQAREEEAAANAKFRADQRLAQLDTEEKTIDISEKVNIESVENLEQGDMSEQDFELFKQEQILAIQADFAQQRVDLLDEELRLKAELYAADGEIDAQEQNQLDSLALQKQGLEKSIDQAEDAQEELASKRSKTSIAEILGLSDDEFDEVKEKLAGVANEVVNGLQQVLDAQTEANEERIDQLDESISASQDALDTELALAEQGFANNVEGKQAELAALEKQREEEFKKQKSLAKKQFALDTAVQASSLITAAANVLKGFSTIPLVGQILGITQVALMVAAFFASRASALSSINSGGPQAATGASGKGSTGKVHGRYHSQGGERFTDHLKIERDEAWAVLSRKATGKHGDVFEKFAMGLNAGRTPDEMMGSLLSGTGVYMKKDIDRKIDNRAAIIRSQEIIMLGNAGNENMEGALDSMDRNLGELKEFEMSKLQIIEKPDGRIEINPKTGKRTYIKYVK